MIIISSHGGGPVTVFVRGPLPSGWPGEIRVPPHSTVVFEQDLRRADAPPSRRAKRNPPPARGSPEYAAEAARLNAELDEYRARDPRRVPPGTGK